MYDRYIQGETQSLYKIPVEAVYSGRFSWSPVPWSDGGSDVSTRDNKHIGELLFMYMLYTVVSLNYTYCMRCCYICVNVSCIVFVL